jgi:hypothetical protein
MTLALSNLPMHEKGHMKIPPPESGLWATHLATKLYIFAKLAHLRQQQWLEVHCKSLLMAHFKTLLLHQNWHGIKQ